MLGFDGFTPSLRLAQRIRAKMLKNQTDLIALQLIHTSEVTVQLSNV